MKLPLRRATWHSSTIEDADGQAIAHTGSSDEADMFITCINYHNDLMEAIEYMLPRVHRHLVSADEIEKIKANYNKAKTIVDDKAK